MFVEEILNEKKDSLIGLGFTRSKLYLDCLSPEDEGVYTCVAETSTLKIANSTSVAVGKYISLLLFVF